MSLSLRKQTHQQNKKKRKKKDRKHFSNAGDWCRSWWIDEYISAELKLWFCFNFFDCMKRKTVFFFLENAINNKQKLKSSSIYPVRFIPSFSIIRPLLLNVCTVQWIACVCVCVVSVCVMILLTCVCPLEKGKWIKSWNWKRIYLESRFSFFFFLKNNFEFSVCIDWTFLSWNKKKKKILIFFSLKFEVFKCADISKFEHELIYSLLDENFPFKKFIFLS